MAAVLPDTVTMVTRLLPVAQGAAVDPSSGPAAGGAVAGSGPTLHHPGPAAGLQNRSASHHRLQLLQTDSLCSLTCRTQTASTACQRKHFRFLTDRFQGKCLT